MADTIGGTSALARAAEVSESVVRKWRNGTSDPAREKLIALASATNVRLEWLALGEGPMRSGDVVSERSDHCNALPINDVPKEAIKSWLEEVWASATPRERTWLEVQFERSFPEFASWRKKNEVKPSKRQNEA